MSTINASANVGVEHLPIQLLSDHLHSHLTLPMTAQLYTETCPPVIWAGHTCRGWVEISVDGWCRGKERRSKNGLLNQGYCQLCLENGCHTCL